MRPDRPPRVNMGMKATAKSMAVGKVALPPHRVKSQLKIFTPVGMAMMAVVAAKAASATGPMPDVNMWWAQTPKPTKPMNTPEKMMAVWPKRGRRVNTGRISETMPMEGRIST